jgi:hypothetical protein
MNLAEVHVTTALEHQEHGYGSRIWNILLKIDSNRSTQYLHRVWLLQAAQSGLLSNQELEEWMEGQPFEVKYPYILVNKKSKTIMILHMTVTVTIRLGVVICL